MFNRKRGKEMELKEAINKLFEMTDEQRLKVFEYSNAEDILNSYRMGTILKTIEDFCAEPKYGDVYERKGDSEEKCVFLGMDYKGKCWLLFNEMHIPQEYPKPNFECYYTKAGENIEDKLKALFK